MNKYIEKERARYWPVSHELMTQYNDGSHTAKYRGDNLYWQNKNGIIHRDGDKPAFIYSDGCLEWWQNNKRHRDGDKPAWISADGRLEWFQNGQMHRLHGPSVIKSDDTLSWWINGKEITQEVNYWLNREPWLGTPEQIFEFQLRFS